MKRLLMCLCLLIFYPVNVAAGDVENIVVVSAEWKNYTNKDGTGAYWEILKAIYEPVGMTVTTITLPWKRALLTVQLNEADAVVGDYRREESGYYLYPETHISYEDPLVVVSKKEGLENWERDDVMSLKGKVVCYIRGYDFDRHSLKGVHFIKHEISTISQGLRLVDIGRADVFMDYEKDVRNTARDMKINLEDNFEVRQLKKREKLYVAFDNSKKSKELVRIFDMRMEKMIEEGTVSKIYDKWGLKEKY